MGSYVNGLSDIQVNAVNTDGSFILIRAPKAKDVPAILARYRSIQIKQADINPESLHSFLQQGGMFQIPSEEEILKECQPNQTCFVIAEGQNAMPEATARFSTDTDIYRQWYADSDDLISYVELIVKSEHSGFAYPFLLSIFNKLHLAGYRTLVYHIYHLISLDEAGVSTPLGFDNHASIGLHRKLEAVRIGSLPEKLLPYGEKLLHIRPDVYSLNLATASEKLHDLCKNVKWRLQP